MRKYALNCFLWRILKTVYDKVLNFSKYLKPELHIKLSKQRAWKFVKQFNIQNKIKITKVNFLVGIKVLIKTLYLSLDILQHQCYYSSLLNFMSHESWHYHVKVYEAFLSFLYDFIYKCLSRVFFLLFIIFTSIPSPITLHSFQSSKEWMKNVFIYRKKWRKGSKMYYMPSQFTLSLIFYGKFVSFFDDTFTSVKSDFFILHRHALLAHKIYIFTPQYYIALMFHTLSMCPRNNS